MGSGISNFSAPPTRHNTWTLAAYKNMAGSALGANRTSTLKVLRTKAGTLRPANPRFRQRPFISQASWSE
jgi:hypothetical protein